MTASGGGAFPDVHAALLDDAREPLLALDRHGKILAANAAAAQFFDRPREHLVGTPLDGLVAVDDRGAFRLALVEAAAAPVESRVRFERGTAHDDPPLVRLRSLGDGSGVLTLHVSEEVGEYVAAPAARGDPAFELDGVLLRLPLAVVGLDEHGTVLFANARARALFAPAPLRRRRPLPVELGGVSLRHLVERLHAMPGPLPAQLLQLPDGRKLRVTGTGVRGDAPAVLLFDDITAYFARFAADELFVRNAAHQLRTPLAGIASAVEVLQGGAKEERAARDQFLESIERETSRLIRLTRALLVLARAHGGVQPPRLDLVRLEPLLRRASAEVRAAPGVDVRVACSSRLAVLAERDLLEEAVTALAENAGRHTYRGTVTLRARPVEDGDIEVEVADSGEGISPEHLEHVFQPFYRVADDREGFGVGLTIAAQAIAAMGGRLDVHSEPRAGTRFAFRLPSAEVVRAAAAPPAERSGTA